MTNEDVIYELARSIWRTKPFTTAKSFDRLSKQVRNIFIEDAKLMIKFLNESGYEISYKKFKNGEN